MTRPPTMSDRLSPSVETWLANRPSARLVAADPPTTAAELEDTMISESQARDARGEGEVARRHGQPEGANPHIGPLADAWMDGWLDPDGAIDRAAKPATA